MYFCDSMFQKKREIRIKLTRRNIDAYEEVEEKSGDVR